jgi:O-antigen chain-terminating methyltransferase
MDALNSQIEIGEPPLESPTLRAKIGFSVKRRLNRLLWWQSNQIKTLLALTIRRSREEIKVIDALTQNIEWSNQQARHIQQVVEALSQSIGRLGQQMRETHQMVFESRQHVRESESRLQQLETENASFRIELQRENASSLEKIGELAQRVEQMAARLSELGLFTHQTRATLSIQDRRLAGFIEEARKRLPNPFTREQLNDMVNHHTDSRYDSLYLAFEDAFRGTREDIKERQSIYLPLLKEHGIGCSVMPVLDLGCGRGEWLELLGEHNLQARGLDSNETMVELCKSTGLDVTQGDALSCLGTLPDACMGAVTSFHMVEHMPFDTVLTLVDEVLRVLKPGGILIFETPNPQNILVGTLTFHFDPTHLKPLPSPMLRFFVEARGFCNVHVRDLHPYPEVVRLPDDGKGVASRLNDYLYGPQDYAVIGQKP